MKTKLKRWGGAALVVLVSSLIAAYLFTRLYFTLDLALLESAFLALFTTLGLAYPLISGFQVLTNWAIRKQAERISEVIAQQQPRPGFRPGGKQFRRKAQRRR